MTVLLVCGGRKYSDKARLEQCLDSFHAWSNVDILINGGATGADLLAKNWADSRGIHHATVPALWKHFDRSAGPKRNSAMLWLRPSVLIAFPGGNGTASMVKLAKEEKLDVYLIS